MADTPELLKYTKDHEWAKIEDGVATIGITDYAQKELGDIVYLELPEKDTNLEQGGSFGEIEAVKTVASLYAPVSGKIIEVNNGLSENAEALNKDPYGEGWIVKIQMSTPAQADALLDAAAYQNLI